MSETDKTSDKTNASRILDILIQNSTVFSGAVSEWTQRIDKIRGVYLTALFGLIGLLLSPNVKPLKDILADIRADNTQMFLVLLLPILNSLLLVYVTSYMHFIYAAAKYNSYYLGSLVTEEIGRKIVPFDDWETTVGDKEAWGRGYATDAMRVRTKFAFETLNLHRVESEVLAENMASQRALEKVGYTREGVFRQHSWSEGRWHDTIRYAILDQDYFAAR